MTRTYSKKRPFDGTNAALIVAGIVIWIVFGTVFIVGIMKW